MTHDRRQAGLEQTQETIFADEAGVNIKKAPECPKLRAAILYLVNKIPGKLNRVRLCKHLYYADGHYYQKFQKTITEFCYLHIEGSPQPMHFNELVFDMVRQKEIEIIPQVVTEIKNDQPAMVLKGLSYTALVPAPQIFSRDERKLLNSIASLFQGDLSLETRYYPNLFQQYAQTNLYEEIVFQLLPGGKKPHISFKAWANKIFRLMQE